MGHMRERKVKAPDGSDQIATEIGFRVAGEHWNEYLADDGSVLRLKPVVTQVLRLKDRHDANGDPMYILHSTNVVTVSAPDNLRVDNA